MHLKVLTKSQHNMIDSFLSFYCNQQQGQL